ncbi:GntR family transcriptional regulator [Streptomyces kroppenstedtii]|uniref:GntR family transcriptional regulator n=1 Tax=Streptomyces kroppenstedtii TaxID=3051181 RepID=UPI0028D82D0A|nr:GntR family transcriptional regulator [Streptomyces sp. DSM 40484]
MATEDLQPYQRIAQDVKDQVRLGRLKANDRLRSTRELAEHYGVAPGTVQRALAELRTDGLIYSHQGRGSFIRENAIEAVADPTARAIARLEQQVAELSERLERLEAREG